MKELRANLWKNIFTHNIELYDRYLRNRMEDFSTLLLGETGTGKGTAASAIGRSGFIPLNRRWRSFVESFTRSFVSLNLSQFPETLIESALFGHKKGAFTGAIEDYDGVFASCSPHGAILLDEIGEVPKPVQIKLLQVLQERAFKPVGSQKHGRFEGRVIAATNRPLDEIREKKIFRDDFYYRLCSDVITVPPLRQRIQETPKELDILLDITVERLVGQPSPELAEMVRAVIDEQLGSDYPWPGNVRELEQCVRRVLLKGNYTGEATFMTQGSGLDRRLVTGIEQGNIEAASLVSGYCYLLYQRHHNFEEVARRTGLDRRTVKKYIQEWQEADDQQA
jgi:transcriptional regulator with GAF, ATPase, and Fis domain